MTSTPPPTPAPAEASGHPRPWRSKGRRIYDATWRVVMECADEDDAYRRCEDVNARPSEQAAWAKPLIDAQSTTWPVRDVLARLADAADHLLNVHSCDAHGYEDVGIARDVARQLVAALDGNAHPDQPPAAPPAIYASSEHNEYPDGRRLPDGTPVEAFRERLQPRPASDLPWRTGTKVPRNLYDAHGNDIGRMDSAEHAARVVEWSRGAVVEPRDAAGGASEEELGRLLFERCVEVCPGPEWEDLSESRRTDYRLRALSFVHLGRSHASAELERLKARVEELEAERESYRDQWNAAVERCAETERRAIKAESQLGVKTVLLSELESANAALRRDVTAMDGLLARQSRELPNPNPPGSPRSWRK